MTSVLCAIVKDEHLFIREWVEHYLSIGFDKIYIHEDFKSNSHYDVLEYYINRGSVELTHLEKEDFPELRGVGIQMEVYRQFFQKCKDGLVNADWAGFFDVDEFLMFDDGWNLGKLEKEFREECGILLAWKLHGASGHIERQNGSVVESYRQHLKEGSLIDSQPRWNVKSLVNIHKCNAMVTHHVFQDCVTTNHSREIKMEFEKAWLNHYYTKSWEDYCIRMERRGNQLNNNRSYDQFFHLSPELQYMEEELLKERLRNTTNDTDTMWISKKHGLIRGGNVKKLESLRRKYISKATHYE